MPQTKEKKKKNKLQSAGGGGSNDKTVYVKTSRDTLKWIAACSAVILAAAIGALIFALVGTTGSNNECEEIRKAVEDGSHTDADIATMNKCLRGNIDSCTFEVETCGVKCPLGFEVDSNLCFSSCQCASQSRGTFQGDVQFAEHDVLNLLKLFGHTGGGEQVSPRATSRMEQSSGSVSTDTVLWDVNRKNGRILVPYDFAPGMNQMARIAIGEAARYFKEKSCIDLVPKDDTLEGLIRFAVGEGCTSNIGMIPAEFAESQLITIGAGCEFPEIVRHELLHAFGFWHEQCRPDRDGFVDIIRENIEAGLEHNFDKINKPVLDLGSSYDLNSVMHYQSEAFSKNFQKFTILTKDGKRISKSMRLSEDDLYELNQLYNCDGTSAGTGSEIESTSSSEVTTSAATQSTVLFTTSAVFTTKKSSMKVFWGEWAPWSKCTATCGPGKILRRRKCQVMHYGHSYPAYTCEGEPVESKECELEECPRKGEPWGTWSEWSKCSKTCGIEVSWRIRRCYGPGGWGCIGQHSDGEECEKKPPCPKTDWSAGAPGFTTIYNPGVASIKPIPGYEAGFTVGVGRKRRGVDSADGAWTEWSIWSSCETSHRHCQKERRRLCVDMKSVQLTTQCAGSRKQIETEIKHSEYENIASHFHGIQKQSQPNVTNTLWCKSGFYFERNIMGKVTEFCLKSHGLVQMKPINTKEQENFREYSLNCQVNSIAVGDINGDMLPDIVCRDPRERYTKIYFLLKSGEVSSPVAIKFCANIRSHLSVFKMKDKDIILCLEVTSHLTHLEFKNNQIHVKK